MHNWSAFLEDYGLIESFLICVVILTKDAQVDIQDNGGRTALMKVCHNGNSSIVRLLLHAGQRTFEQKHTISHPLLQEISYGYL